MADSDGKRIIQELGFLQKLVLDPILHRSEITRCTCQEWYEFCINKVKGPVDLFIAAGKGEFLDLDNGTIRAGLMKRLRATAVAPSPKETPITVTALFDSPSPTTEDIVNSILKEVPDRFAVYRAKVKILDGHFSICGDHVYVERRHEPGAEPHERWGFRASRMRSALQNAAKEWNGFVRREDVVSWLAAAQHTATSGEAAG